MPNNWAITSFEEIVELISGRDLETSSCNDIKEGIPYLIGASNIVKRSLFITRWTTKPIVISQKNDILISCKGTIGEVIRNTIGDIHIARQFMALRNNSIVDTNYIELYIRAILERIKSDARGVIPGISREDILCREILLPPLNEQKRIVLEASKLISIIEKINVDKNELVKAIAAYKLTILQLAITGKLVPQDLSDEPAIDLLRRVNPNYKPCDNRHYRQLPDSWQVVKIKDVFTINPKNKVDDDIDAGFVSMSMIDDGYRDSYQFEKKKWSLIKSGFTHFQDGDIAVAKISPCLENRKSMILKKLPNSIGAGTTELHIFRSSIVDSKFALYFFKSDYFINQCIGTFNGAVGQQRVRKNTIEDIEFPLPPYEEQKRISEKITHIFECLDKITAEL